MRPMTRIFWGMLIVVVDLRIGDFDVVVDVVGWLLAAGGLRRLRDVDPWFRRAWSGAMVGAVGSLAQVVPGSGIPMWLQTSVETVAITLLVFGVCTVVVRTAADDPTLEGRARVIRALHLTTSAIALLLTPVTVDTVEVAGALAVILLVFAVVTFTVLVCFLVLVWSVRRRFDLGEPAPTALSEGPTPTAG